MQRLCDATDITRLVITGPKNADTLGRHKQSSSHLILTAQLDTLEKNPHQAHHSSTESSEVFASDVTEFEDLAEVLRNNDLFEFETQSNLPLLVKGKLCRNLGFWESIGTDRLILDVIKFGCKLPFSDLPVPVEIKNNKSALSHAPLALADLHKTGRVVQCQEPPLVVNPLSVAVQAGGGGGGGGRG